MLTLFHSPGSCSTACHIALEGSGLAYRIITVSTATGENLKSDYLAVNPLGKVPALRLEDGSILTENPAILQHIARLAPASRLMPDGPMATARAQEWLNFLSSGVHIAFRMVFRPERHTSDPQGAEHVRSRGIEQLCDVLETAEARIVSRTTRFAVADHFTVVDAYALIY